MKTKFNSLKRWKIGHQLFSCIDQWLIITLKKLELSHMNKDWKKTEQIFYLAADFLDVSHLAMKYTGDIPSGVYNEETVADMQVYAKDKMSGGNIQDHVHLVKYIKNLELHKLRPSWPQFVQQAHDAFLIALASCIDGHKHACIQMAGSRVPLSKPDAKENASDLLEKLNISRKRSAGSTIFEGDKI